VKQGRCNQRHEHKPKEIPSNETALKEINFTLLYIWTQQKFKAQWSNESLKRHKYDYII